MFGVLVRLIIIVSFTIMAIVMYKDLGLNGVIESKMFILASIVVIFSNIELLIRSIVKGDNL